MEGHFRETILCIHELLHSIHDLAVFIMLESPSIVVMFVRREDYKMNMVLTNSPYHIFLPQEIHGPSLNYILTCRANSELVVYHNQSLIFKVLGQGALQMR